MDVRLWPGGTSGWEWVWQPYPGVWLAVLAAVVCYVLLLRRARAASGPAALPVRGHRYPLLFALGLVALWAAIDWPLGALAAGHLLSAHASQYLVISFVAAPLLLLGLPPGVLGRGAEANGAWFARGVAHWGTGVLRRLTHPAVALAIFVVVALGSFLPPVVEFVRPGVLGALGIAIMWLASALVLWWPVVGPTPHIHRLSYLVGVGYLFLPFAVPKAPGAFFVFAEEAVFPVYAAAPRVSGLSAVTDQHLAGFALWIVGSVMILVALGVLFFRWYDEDRRMARPDSLGVPANPEAVEVLFGVPRAWAALEQLIAIVDGALPAEHSGAELAFAVHGRRSHDAAAGSSRQVVLELRAALSPEAEEALSARIALEYEAFLRTLAEADRGVVAEHLNFRVIGYGSRVG